MEISFYSEGLTYICQNKSCWGGGRKLTTSGDVTNLPKCIITLTTSGQQKQRKKHNQKNNKTIFQLTQPRHHSLDKAFRT